MRCSLVKNSVEGMNEVLQYRLLRGLSTAGAGGAVAAAGSGAAAAAAAAAPLPAAATAPPAPAVERPLKSLYCNTSFMPSTLFFTSEHLIQAFYAVFHQRT
mmetsp:Transcript_26413/g.57926  ORF Transcript_26413/g.57926 Transcript_26413/m.57926 type:complete len:101 (-) Transcript_26413:25-327(-)